MMNLKKLSFLVMSYLLWVCIPSFAQEKPSLQSLFNESDAARAKANASDDVIVIDLSEWLNEYDQTLQIATGKSYRFTNGELKWIGGDAPLITVSNGSSVDFDATVRVLGRTIQEETYTTIPSSLIIIKDAEVQVHGASFYSNKTLVGLSAYTADVFYLENMHNDPNLAGKLSLYSCNIEGSISNDSRCGEVSISNKNGNKNIIEGGIKSNASARINTGKARIDNIILLSKLSNGFSYPDPATGVNPVWFNIYKYNHTIDLSSHGFLSLGSCIGVDDFKSILPLAAGYTGVSNEYIKVDETSYTNGERKIAEGINGYKIVQKDLEALAVQGLDMQKYELVLRDNAVYIQQKSLTGQQWLQEQINSYVYIKTDTDEQPGVITIPEEGIELTDFLRVPDGVFVKLTGGPITISKNFNSSPDMAVRIENGAHLFIDNTWDFNSLPLKSYAWLFANHGHLTFGENSMLLNTWSETKRSNAFIHNYGRLDCSLVRHKDWVKMVNGVFVDGTGDVTINSGYIISQEETIEAKNVTVNGGYIHSHTNGKITIKAENFYMYGGVVYPFVDADYMEFAGGSIHGMFEISVNNITTFGEIDGGEIVFKDNDKEHCLYLTSSLIYKHTTIKANWSRMDFSKPYVIVRGKDYQLTKEDLEKFYFEDLPSDVRAKLEGNTIVLTKGNKSLIDLFNEADEGTEEDPTDIMGDQDDVDVEEPTDGKPDLHILFGDSKNKEDGEKPKKSLTFLFDGEYGIRIPATSSFEFKNININLGEHAINNVIEVYGKLIINVNVYIHQVCTCTKHVIYVRPGGTLIWRGGKNSIPGVVIYNDGGTVIYEGGDTYGTTYGVHNTNGGTVIIKGGSIGGGDHAIYNPSGGEIQLYDGCTVNGSIYSDGNITTGGNVGISNIYIPWTCHINLTSRITNNWFININNIQNITVPTPFIYGTNGYKLTEEDLERIKTNLPETYYLILDVNVNIIYIVDSCHDGIENTTTDDATLTGKIYSTDGRLDKGGEGIKIVRYSDGTTRKIIRK